MCRLGDHDATTLAASLSLSLSLSIALFRSHSVSLSLSSYLPLFLGVAAVCRESSSFTPAGHTGTLPCLLTSAVAGECGADNILC